MKGPPPVRSRDHLWGFPWLFGQLKHDVLVGNSLVVFSVDMLEAAQETQLSIQGVPIRTFMEHPEDLGGAWREEDGAWLVPASIWQWDRLQRLVEESELLHGCLSSMLLGSSVAEAHKDPFESSTASSLGCCRVANV